MCGALGADPDEQFGGWLVSGVFRHELASEGFLQDGVAQDFGSLEVGFDV